MSRKSALRSIDGMQRHMLYQSMMMKSQLHTPVWHVDAWVKSGIVSARLLRNRFMPTQYIPIELEHPSPPLLEISLKESAPPSIPAQRVDRYNHTRNDSISTLRGTSVVRAVLAGNLPVLTLTLQQHTAGDEILTVTHLAKLDSASVDHAFASRNAAEQAAIDRICEQQSLIAILRSNNSYAIANVQLNNEMAGLEMGVSHARDGWTVRYVPNVDCVETLVASDGILHFGMNSFQTMSS